GTPEETRGSDVGYTVEEFLQFVDELGKIRPLDYLAIASRGRNIYKATVRAEGKNGGEYVNKIVYEHVKGKIQLMVTDGINTPENGLETLQFGDTVGMSSPFITEPDLVKKLEAGNEDEITLQFEIDELNDLKIPQAAFKDIVRMIDYGEGLPKDTRDELRRLADEKE